jgi:hypothetical protein
MQVESVREQGSRDDIWGYGGGSKNRLEKICIMRSFELGRPRHNYYGKWDKFGTEKRNGSIQDLGRKAVNWKT